MPRHVPPVTERLSWTISEFAALNGLTWFAIKKAIKQGKLHAAPLWEGGRLHVLAEPFIQQIAERLKGQGR